MDDKRSAADKLQPIEGVGEGALGMGPPPESAPESAEVVDELNRVPGPDFGDHPATADKPWFTSLAAESDQAGVANDPPDSDDDPQ